MEIGRGGMSNKKDSKKRVRSGEIFDDDDDSRSKTFKMGGELDESTATLDPALSTDDKLNVLFQQNIRMLKELKGMRGENLFLKEKLEIQQQQINKLERQLDIMEMKTRKKNVVFKGIRITDRKNVTGCVLQQLKQTNPRIQIRMRARVVGQYGDKVVAELDGNDDKITLIKNSVNLRKNGITFDEDLPPRLRKAKNALLKKRRELIVDGVKRESIKLNYYDMMVNGKDWYDYDGVTDGVVLRQNIQLLSQ